ncbi:MAG TPA: AGE family epimerase/isomerase [Spirochaetia bacterium]|nr:AGE family epimerase/isomerase [Spirochaetia bacterium]
MATGIPPARARRLADEYRSALFNDVVPWWIDHSIDQEAGGYFSCLDREGKPYAFDKFTWPTARQVWMLSRLYNSERRNPVWLEAARHGARWIQSHGFSGGEKMHFRTARDGTPLAGSLSLFSESFTAIAFAEFGKASGETLYTDRAKEMFESLLERLGKPTDTAQLGYPLKTEFHVHGHDMIRLTIARVFTETINDPRWMREVDRSIDSMLRLHWKPELPAFLENVSPTGSTMFELPEGRMIMPGHTCESAWMMLEVARERGDEALKATCRKIVLSAMEAGWDEEYGGLRYLLNLDHSPAHPLEADLKLWWVQVEALYALLLLWDSAGSEGDTEVERWYDLVHSYTFDLYPDDRYGEWIGYRNRDGSPIFTAKANGWKGFFHLPRVLLRGYQLLSAATKGELG